MLEIRNITKKFGGVTALNKCSFTVPRHKITALIGPNGAGKTTLFDVISGLVAPDKGDILIDNQKLMGQRPHQISLLGIARTWQQVRLFKYLTMVDHLQLAESTTDTKLFQNLVKQPKVDTARYQKVIEDFAIDRPLDTVVTDLSYGQRKLLQLALVVVKPHRLLLLDEPVAGVNAVVQQRIENLLLSWPVKDETIIIVEHDIEFVQRLADYVVVMNQGCVLAEGKPENVLPDPRVAEAYLGS
ncbi:MAG: ATP-binding cassette domain-containing protein [Candidatus Andersenbacteria bacterium]|nr:ATP-binding cassette domain-containing protein [Candidatus Andersenbacteria bacterium]